MEGAAADAVVLVLEETEVVLPLEGMIDLEAERHRLEGEIERARVDFSRLESRLGDEAFLSRAPDKVVKKERERLGVCRDKLEKLERKLDRLSWAIIK